MIAWFGVMYCIAFPVVAFVFLPVFYNLRHASLYEVCLIAIMLQNYRCLFSVFREKILLFLQDYIFFIICHTGNDSFNHLQTVELCLDAFLPVCSGLRSSFGLICCIPYTYFRSHFANSFYFGLLPLPGKS